MKLFIKTLLLITNSSATQVGTLSANVLQQRQLHAKTDSQQVNLYLHHATLTNAYADSAIRLLNNMCGQPKYTTQYITTTFALAHITKAKLQTNNYVKAIAELDTALKLYTIIKDQHNIAKTKVLIGSQYLKIQLYDKALYYFKQALALQTHATVVDSSAIMETYCNIGLCLASNNNYNQALSTILPAYHYFKAHNNTQLTFETGCLLSQVYIIINNKNRATSVLQQVERYINNTTPAKDVFYFYISLADLNKNNLPTALYYLNKANTFSSRLSITDARLLSLKYASIYKLMQNYTLATKYYSLYVQQTDSVFNANNINVTINYQTKYETVAKENKILQLSKTSALQQLSLQQQNARNELLLWCALLALLVIIALVALAYLLRTTIHKLNTLNAQIINNTNTLTQQASTISRYQSQMNPHFIFNAINSIQGLLLNKEHNLVYTQLDALSVLMRKTLHNSENEYIPLNEELSYLSNYVAFEKTNASFNFTFDIKIHNKLTSTDLLIPPMLLQPFIENSIKHGGFNTVNNAHIQLIIQLESSSIITITITDNGIGLSKTKNLVHASRALTIVEQRLSLCFKANNIVCNNFLSTYSSTNGYSVTIKLPYLSQF